MTAPDRTDETERLLERARAGEGEAWRALVTRSGPAAAAAARSAGARDADVDDVCQATWVALYRSLEFLRSGAALASWVRTTARREAARLRERNVRRADLERVAEPEVTAPEDAPLDGLARLELALAVREALDRLGAPCSELLAGLFLEPSEPSYEELAGRLGMRPGSVGPTKQRCLAKLARLLETMGHGPGPT